MWRLVNYDGKKTSSRPSRRCRYASLSSNFMTPASDSECKVPINGKQITKLVKNLRRTACALRSNNMLQFEKLLQFVEQFVRSFLDLHLYPTICEGETNRNNIEDQNQENLPFPSIRLIALGIGPFDRQQDQQQHLAGFLQMSAFLALRDACQRAINLISGEFAQSLSVSTGAVCDAKDGMNGAASSPPQQHVPHSHSQPTNKDVIHFHTCFYDPICGPLHRLCCQRLAIEVETHNTCGVYRPENTSQLVIVFAPHCPWGLLHNLLVANWPSSSSPTKGERHSGSGGHICNKPALPLRRVLLFANDLRGFPFAPGEPSAWALWSLSHEGLRSCLAIEPLRGQTRGKATRSRTRPIDASTSMALAADGEYARLRDRDLAEESAEATLGVSPQGLLAAFSDLAFMCVKEELSDTEITARLRPGTRSLTPLTQSQELH
ncbi:unnamed protein product [Phytomonas sp. Hart1]|nr:unnamed protein product [Phytomonas sp. Hart1]|eukprot:CCW70692.1 unnamed protein product [Phytomonas sp. isolate Hart1]